MKESLEEKAFQSSNAIKEQHQRRLWESGVPLVEAEPRAMLLQLAFLSGVYWVLAQQEMTSRSSCTTRTPTT
jgi:hypothetical protein